MTRRVESLPADTNTLQEIRQGKTGDGSLSYENMKENRPLSYLKMRQRTVPCLMLRGMIDLCRRDFCCGYKERKYSNEKIKS